jgi:hypothetical protein
MFSSLLPSSCDQCFTSDTLTLKTATQGLPKSWKSLNIQCGLISNSRSRTLNSSGRNIRDIGRFLSFLITVPIFPLSFSLLSPSYPHLLYSSYPLVILFRLPPNPVSFPPTSFFFFFAYPDSAVGIATGYGLDD